MNGFDFTLEAFLGRIPFSNAGVRGVFLSNEPSSTCFSILLISGAEYLAADFQVPSPGFVTLSERFFLPTNHKAACI